MVAAPPSEYPESLYGSLADLGAYDLTTHIGTRFPPSVQLSALLASPDKLASLATLVSHRGVVFFAAQDIQIAQQLELAQRLGEAAGKPETSKLHRHPISESIGELGAEVSVISSMGGISRAGLQEGRRAANGWHADITFEHVPSDYAILKMHTLPKVGGDTLWASGYEAYDRLSPAYQKFLEGLTAIHNADFFIEMSKRLGMRIQDPRGSPENTGSDLTAVHPVIRTHPVTGFKALFVNKSFTKRIVELTADESDHVLEYLFRHISENHDLQVRYRWEKNDVAIWDNRATFHTATNDYTDNREGNRAVSIGERPYFDPKSKSRREVLGISV
ncbi:taurine catabolism dioxygenase [Leucogyrophana mollusca]|uniref:Taurine catabolism dioxygenase n=1 Tax=Leucogyrophana mollusca TaxID=85980 RepID=A0ACB8B7B9_9AGAM|nr:taurine catabolism dioxygenase [Leucogyrophana mollusca]